MRSIATHMCSTAAQPLSDFEPGVDRATEPRPLADLEREICELAAHLAAATCRWLLLLGEFDERCGWGDWGLKSCAHWLSWRCSLGLGTAREHVRVARRLRELPLVSAAFATGELTYCKVRAITRVATPETEEQLVELGSRASGAQLEKVVRGYRGALDATVASAERAHDMRYLRWQWEDDGSLRLQARLSAEDGALVLAALEAAAAEDVPAGTSESGSTSAGEDVCAVASAASPAGARRADALVSIARSALSEGDVARTGGDPCEVVVHVDVETLASEQLHARAELADGPAIAPETVRRLGCDAAVVRIFERDGRPLSVGRRKRTIPPALRRALRSRDDGCRFPGCTYRRFLHAHHIQHWAQGGETKLDNLVPLCSFHHRLVHEGGYGVERAGTTALRFRRPDGRTIRAAQPSARATGPPLELQHRLRGLNIDERTCMGRFAGDPIDYGIAVEGLLHQD